MVWLRELCAYLLLGAVASSSDNEHSFNATCTLGNKLIVRAYFHRPAEILELTYGSCNENSTSGVQGVVQHADLSFEITLDLIECEMFPGLASEQDAILRIGRHSVDISTGEDKVLSFAEFELDSECTIIETYEVIFDYGTLSTTEQTFNESGGYIDKTFIIKAYDANYTIEDFDHSTIAGLMIYLGITLVDDSFDYNYREFAPLTCTFKDILLNFEYTLFNAEVSGGCQNDDVNFATSYDGENHIWRFEHILFLLADVDESTFQLKCTMVICDILDDSKCDAVRTECGIPLSGLFGCTKTDGWTSDHVGWTCTDTDPCAKETTCEETYDVVSHHIAKNGKGDDAFCTSFYLGHDTYYVNDDLGAWRDHCCPAHFENTRFCNFGPAQKGRSIAGGELSSRKG